MIQITIGKKEPLILKASLESQLTLYSVVQIISVQIDLKVYTVLKAKLYISIEMKCQLVLLILGRGL